MDGLEGVAGEGTSPDTFGDMVVAPAVGCQKGNALLRHALAQAKIQAAKKMASIDVNEQWGSGCGCCITQAPSLIPPHCAPRPRRLGVRRGRPLPSSMPLLGGYLHMRR